MSRPIAACLILGALAPLAIFAGAAKREPGPRPPELPAGSWSEDRALAAHWQLELETRLGRLYGAGRTAASVAVLLDPSEQETRSELLDPGTTVPVERASDGTGAIARATRYETSRTIEHRREIRSRVVDVQVVLFADPALCGEGEQTTLPRTRETREHLAAEMRDLAAATIPVEAIGCEPERCIRIHWRALPARRASPAPTTDGTFAAPWTWGLSLLALALLGSLVVRLGRRDRSRPVRAGQHEGAEAEGSLGPDPERFARAWERWTHDPRRAGDAARLLLDLSPHAAGELIARVGADRLSAALGAFESELDRVETPLDAELRAARFDAELRATTPAGEDPRPHRSPEEELGAASADELHALFADENPRVVAALLSILPGAASGAVLAVATDAERRTWIERLATGDAPHTEASRSLLEAAGRKLEALRRNGRAAGPATRIENLARVLGSTSPQVAEAALEELRRDADPALAEKVRESWIRFEDLLRLDSSELRRFLAHVEISELASALDDLEHAVCDELLERLPERVRRRLEEERSANADDPTRGRGEEARLRIARELRQHIESGRLVIAAAGAAR